MSENILEINGNTMIFNGGDPLPGCPKSYEDADEWAREANKNKDGFSEPTWSFDCSFKLDFDGPLISVESRFYPPKTHYGSKWDGIVSISLGKKLVEEKEFECDSLDELKEEVEAYIDSIYKKLEFLLFEEE